MTKPPCAVRADVEDEVPAVGRPVALLIADDQSKRRSAPSVAAARVEVDVSRGRVAAGREGGAVAAVPGELTPRTTAATAWQPPVAETIPSGPVATRVTSNMASVGSCAEVDIGCGLEPVCVRSRRCRGRRAHRQNSRRERYRSDDRKQAAKQPRVEIASCEVPFVCARAVWPATGFSPGLRLCSWRSH